MKCKHFRSLILEQPDRELTAGESRMLADHLSGCRECLAFKQELLLLGGLIGENRFPELSTDVEREVRKRCHRALRERETAKQAAEKIPAWLGIPRGILLSLFLLVAITMILILTGFGEISIGNTLSAGDLLILMLVLQNAVMLLFSPVLFRKYGRMTSRNIREARNG